MSSIGVDWTLDLLRSQASVAATSGEVPDAGRSVVSTRTRRLTTWSLEAANDQQTIQRDESRAVIEATLQYLEVIGAIGPEPGRNETP